MKRRDKNVRAGYLTLMRHLLYLADAVHLRIVLSRARRGGAQVIVMDRYLYDELANLPLENRFSAAYAQAARMDRAASGARFSAGHRS